MLKTKMICNIGPETQFIEKLYLSGMRVVRGAEALLPAEESIGEGAAS